MLIIIFGMAGSGKNFVGQLLEKHFGFFFWDADKDLPHEMQVCIREKKNFTQQMRDNFTQVIIQKIIQLKKKHKYIVVTQALYKEKNRQQILSFFPDALFILVKTNENIILERLKLRQEAVDIQYAQQISANFESPMLQHKVVMNNGDETDLIIQLKDLIDL